MHVTISGTGSNNHLLIRRQRMVAAAALDLPVRLVLQDRPVRPVKTALRVRPAARVRPAPKGRPATTAPKDRQVRRARRVPQARKALRDLRAQSEQEIHKGD
jgi:hypothetical protein